MRTYGELANSVATMVTSASQPAHVDAAWVAFHGVVQHFRADFSLADALLLARGPGLVGYWDRLVELSGPMDDAQQHAARKACISLLYDAEDLLSSSAAVLVAAALPLAYRLLAAGHARALELLAWIEKF